MHNFFFLFPAKTTHSSGRPTLSHSVRQEERVSRSCTKNLYRVAPVRTLIVIPRFVSFIEFGESVIIGQLQRTPEFGGVASLE
ncbi:hypothetical protein PoB_000129600 [Plakobranchus ocellatus]|uniref:Uncharacterized protein n=1 Tax=Plakobranchus ocellatus TaxID=259542 RepID=A0AAV3XVH6_9GAST|nr:hypothetical protein PoB_000129600 [Plakobranchus ocellatus]